MVAHSKGRTSFVRDNPIRDNTRLGDQRMIASEASSILTEEIATAAMVIAIETRTSVIGIEA
jgi:hypothetical protein